MQIEPDGTGERERVTINGESFYFIATQGEDGWIHFTATVPYENRNENEKLRAAVDGTCRALTKRINKLLGNVGRPKGADK